jgi:ABC-2 type transport system ATP-binding protein
LWNVVRGLRDDGVTVILTTHYIEEAEELADRVGVINKGGLVLIEDKAVLMQKLGKKKLTLDLAKPLRTLPRALRKYGLELQDEGRVLLYVYDTRNAAGSISGLMKDLAAARIDYKDLHTEQSSLEDIFMGLVTQ